MILKCFINGKAVTADISPDMALLEFVRSQGCYSVKRGCETSNCGLCTVWVEGATTVWEHWDGIMENGDSLAIAELLQKEAEEFAVFLGGEGAEQCGYCAPGFVMNVLAMVRELDDPTEEEIKEYLAGNLCRCTGYVGQLRAIKKYLAWKKEQEA